jgi:hypothetical protein
VKGWLGWKARLEHFLFGENECLCVTCCKTREDIERAWLRNSLKKPPTRAQLRRPEEWSEFSE